MDRRTGMGTAIQARYGIAKQQLQIGAIGSDWRGAYAQSMLRPLVLASLVLAGSTGSSAQTPSNADIRAVADAFDSAQQHRDRAALEAMLAPDFLIVYGSGKVGGRADFIAGFTAPGGSLDPFVITDRLFLRVSPDVAIVGGDGRMSGTENGQRFARHFRYSDTFVRRDGKWWAIFTQVTPLPN